jgi:predicted ABC-class ATPase
MPTQATLRQQLLDLHQKSYSAYKQIRGTYTFPGFTLIIDWVQGDPFASPSQCRVQVPQALAAFPETLSASPSREIALRDYLTRQFAQAAQAICQRCGSGNSGLIAISQPGPEILNRTTVMLTPDAVEARFVVGLPAHGRRIAGWDAATLFGEQLPQLVASTMSYAELDADDLRAQVETAEDADWLRHQLSTNGLVAFVANGAILPRRSGVDKRSLQEGAITFQSPATLQVQFDCPNRGLITGMGIPKGVTLIVGGGYHGKSTLLKAIERGIYTHIPGDGREFVVTDPTAVKIRAEEGRSITSVDLSPFINHLPQGQSTHQFSTQNASGSTSQAANLIEALEVGARVLLIDEDTAATNLMIRDRRMQALIAKDKEPITPFIDKARQLSTEKSVSTILVMGGSGDYFEVADTVIAMSEFEPQEVTAQATAIAQQYPTARASEEGSAFGSITSRHISWESFAPLSDRRPSHWKVRDHQTLVCQQDTIDLRDVEQLVDKGQLNAIAAAIVFLQRQQWAQDQALAEVLTRLMRELQTHSLDLISPFPQGNLAEFRPYELAAAINRWRRLQVTKTSPLGSNLA